MQMMTSYQKNINPFRLRLFRLEGLRNIKLNALPTNDDRYIKKPQ